MCNYGKLRGFPACLRRGAIGFYGLVYGFKCYKAFVRFDPGLPVVVLGIRSFWGAKTSEVLESLGFGVGPSAKIPVLTRLPGQFQGPQ